MREIITLQLGTLSNFVATHFWNTQESYFSYKDNEDSSPICHDIHWRAGIGADGSDIFLPRTVIYDVRSAFGSLRKINAIYTADEDEIKQRNTLSWTGTSSVHQLPPISPSAYIQQLNSGTLTSQLDAESVRYWSDFSRVYFHPRSIVPLHEHDIGLTPDVSSVSAPWELGRQLFGSLCRDEDLVDRDWRPFVEECDQLQGINVITTIDDTWGGFATAYLERLRDEYGKACIWTWGLQKTEKAALKSIDERRLHISNVSQSLSCLCDVTTTLVPLSLPREPFPPYFAADDPSEWNASAVMATGLETATISTRSPGTSGRLTQQLDSISDSLNARGNQPIAKLRLKISDPTETPWIFCEGPEGSLDTTGLGGIKLSTFGHTTALKPGSGNTCFFGLIHIIRGFGQQDRITTGSLNQIRHDYSFGFPILDSFPRVYGPQAKPGSSQQVETLLSTDTTVAADLRWLQKEARGHIGLDDREALVNFLGDMSEAYEDAWSSVSGEDDY